jgi:hypothetical protein
MHHWCRIRHTDMHIAASVRGGTPTHVPVRTLTPNDVPPIHAFVPKSRYPTALADLSPAACLDFQMERLVHNDTKCKTVIDPPPQGSSVCPHIFFSAMSLPPLHVWVVSDGVSGHWSRGKSISRVMFCLIPPCLVTTFTPRIPAPNQPLPCHHLLSFPSLCV